MIALPTTERDEQKEALVAPSKVAVYIVAAHDGARFRDLIQARITISARYR